MYNTEYFIPGKFASGRIILSIALYRLLRLSVVNGKWNESFSDVCKVSQSKVSLARFDGSRDTSFRIFAQKREWLSRRNSSRKQECVRRPCPLTNCSLVTNLCEIHIKIYLWKFQPEFVFKKFWKKFSLVALHPCNRANPLARRGKPHTR